MAAKKAGAVSTAPAFLSFGHVRSGWPGWSESDGKSPLPRGEG